MKSMRILLLGLLSIGVAGPATAQLGDSEQPGSVLVFPKFIKGTFNDKLVSGKNPHAQTELEISVVCPTVLRGPDGSCALGALGNSVHLRGHWVCPPDVGHDNSSIISGNTCSETDFNLETTINGSLYFNPQGVTLTCLPTTPPICFVGTGGSTFPSNATTNIPPPPCDKGYLIVWVTDGSGRAIKFDGLIGDAILRTPTDLENVSTASTSARGYNAIAIQAGPDAGAFTTGSLTDLNGNGFLDFDGAEYMQVPGRIVGTVRYENSVAPGIVTTDLTLLTLDVLSGLDNRVTTVKYHFYTENESLTSGDTSFVCWAEKRLTEINSSLTVQNQNGSRKGLVESTKVVQKFPFDPIETSASVLGLVETFEYVGTAVVRDYAYSLGGDTPVTTIFEP